MPFLSYSHKKMEYVFSIRLRKAAVFLNLLLLVQLSIIFASGLPHPKACKNDLVGYSSNSGRDLFYINGKLVNKRMFCKALKRYISNHCFIGENLPNRYCELDPTLDELPLVGGRKFLQQVATEETTGHEKGHPSEAKDDHKSVLTPKNLSMAVPGIFIICCSFLCPCFRAKKKESSHTVLTKGPNLMDSASSLELNPTEKIPASPMRVLPSPSRFSMSPKLSRVGSMHLNMSQVARATQNFSPLLKLGEGGFGTVYKAQLQDGQVVAIKRARREHFDALRAEFKNEVELLAKIDHRNLVKLLGYVEKGNERLIITEYVPNGTLREHLDGLRGKPLDFNQRLEISIDIAHALTYLHLYSEKQIIHRDVKSSNILMTESMRPKVSDFGFARLGDNDDKTHVLTRVKGTVGYLDPEYMRTFKLTPKSDVYSFGVLLLEILTGRRPVESKRSVEEKVTIRWVFTKYNEGSIKEMVDPLMNEGVEEKILKKMFGLAIQCGAPIRADRPDMKSVGEQLWRIRMDYLKSVGRK